MFIVSSLISRLTDPNATPNYLSLLQSILETRKSCLSRMQSDLDIWSTFALLGFLESDYACRVEAAATLKTLLIRLRQLGVSRHYGISRASLLVFLHDRISYVRNAVSDAIDVLRDHCGLSFERDCELVDKDSFLLLNLNNEIVKSASLPRNEKDCSDIAKLDVTSNLDKIFSEILFQDTVPTVRASDGAEIPRLGRKEIDIRSLRT